MNVYTHVHLADEVAEALKKLLKKYSDLQSSPATLVSTVNGVLVHTNFQTIFKLKSLSALENALHHHIMAHAVKAETIVPGGFDNCLRILVDQKSDIAPTHIDQSILRYPLPNLSDLRKVIERYVQPNVPKHIAGMVVDAVDLAGFSGKIVIEKTGNKPSVEHVAGYSFSLNPAINVSHGTTIIEPRIVCIDGIIESVAEVHHLFEQVAESNQVCLLFVRGMADDVKHTIKVNFDRGKMKIVPFIVRFDFDGINTLVDIATVSGNDVVSSHRGDLISAVALHEHRSVERVDVANNSVIIFNRSTVGAVSVHLTNLLAKRSEANEHLVDMIDQRIKSLASNTVFIRLPDDMNYVVSSQAIDYALRAIKSSMSYGVTHDDQGRIEPSIVKIVAEKFARSCYNSLHSLGATITSAGRQQQVT